MASNRKNKRKTVNTNLILFFLILVLIGFGWTIYTGYHSSMHLRKLFSISMLALFAGILFESFRISDDWKNVVYKFIGSYLLSLLCFLPGKGEQHYNFESHLALWPYVFVLFFALATVIFDRDKVTAKLTEGITLLQCISLIYWIVDYGILNIDHWFPKTLLIIALLFSVFSIINALTNIQLTRTIRLILSIWSTVVMFAFAVDNIIRVLSNQNIENTEYLSEGLYIGLQFFLLGVSAAYIMQDYILLASFIPSKNGNYRNDLAENIEHHIDRYSDKQIFTEHALFCILYAVTIYGLNYEYRVLPRHTIIWLFFLTFPLVLRLTNKIRS